MAKQLTLRGVDAPLERHLHAEARRRGLSINRTALQLLRQAVGLEGALAAAPRRREHFIDLDHLFGTWTEDEAKEFDRALAEVRRMDPELWR